MGKGIERDWPADDELVAHCLRYPSVTKAGAALTPPAADSTLRKRLHKIGRLEEVQAAHRAAKQTTAPTDGPVSVEEILRQELQEAREALKRQRTHDVREERVIAALAELVPRAKVRYRPKAIPPRSGRNAHTLCLLWSDLHAGEVVSEEEMNGLNAYDWQIMLRRHDELRRGIASWAEMFQPVEELVVLALGDMQSGNIHQELAETNEMPMAEVTVQLGLDGAEWLASLLEVVPRVRVVGVVGNHPRFTPKQRSKGRFDNGDWLSYHIMAQRLRAEPRIQIEVPKPQQALVDIYGRTLCALHGDGIRSTMVDVPWGGIIRYTNKLRNQYAQQGVLVDHFALGHFHEPNVVKNRRILMNGSVKGEDEYARDRFGGGEPPTQLLAPFHRKWGMVGAQYVDLEPRRLREAA